MACNMVLAMKLGQGLVCGLRGLGFRGLGFRLRV